MHNSGVHCFSPPLRSGPKPFPKRKGEAESSYRRRLGILGFDRRSGMRGQRYTAEQLAASAAAGDPREESEFSDRAAFQRWQDEWFSVVTMGETLPQVGDPNRAKRWKATRRQRKAIEEQRLLMEAPTVQPRPLDEPIDQQEWLRWLRCEQQRERRKRERQERDAIARLPGTKERQEQEKVEEQVAKLHDVAGASIVENALLLPHYNAYDAACKKRTRRLDEQEALLAQLLVKAGAADSTADAQRFIQAAHVLGIIHAQCAPALSALTDTSPPHSHMPVLAARYDKLVTFVDSLACQAQWYIRFLDRLHHAGEAARLPRGPGEVPGDTPEDMDEECSAKFARLSFNTRQLMNLPAEGDASAACADRTARSCACAAVQVVFFEQDTSSGTTRTKPGCTGRRGPPTRRSR